MTLKQVLDAKMDSAENRKELDKWLRRLPVLKNKDEDESIKIGDLEKLLRVMLTKFGYSFQYIMPGMGKDNDGQPVFWYSASFKERATNQWVDSIYGASIYEVYAKSCLMVFAKGKGGSK